MTVRPLDLHALDVPQRSGLPPCLFVPIAARDVGAIQTYVGRTIALLAGRVPDRAVLVEAYEPEAADPRLPIWAMPRAGVLHARLQVWVDVDYHPYRRAYGRAFPEVVLKGLVLDHVLNRRVARLKGFRYLRLVPISNATNASHGGLSEGWGVELNSSPPVRTINAASKAVVQYADLADIVKMLDMEGGGGLMDTVNDAQAWVVPPAPAGSTE
ncbi:MAG: hypothetical protein K8T90_15595 [Planctomycetes bacterium]|nr:hypothetical protein [Planctomycetota bacterium]